jgi:hypothetical protein
MTLNISDNLGLYVSYYSDLCIINEMLSYLHTPYTDEVIDMVSQSLFFPGMKGLLLFVKSFRNDVNCDVS